MVRVLRASNSYVIADEGGWLPGCFVSETSARRAGNALSCEQLQAIQDRKNDEAGGVGGLITDADVDEALERQSPAPADAGRG